MHILLLSHRYSMSGASLMLLSLADLLLAAGHRITLASMDSGDGPMRAAFAERGIPLVNPIRTDDIDVVVANTLPSAPSVIELARRTRTIWWIHESDYGFDLLVRNPGWNEAFLSAQRIVFVSDHQHDTIFRSFVRMRRPENVLVIPNGLHPPEPYAVETKTRAFRIVCVGTVHPQKRQRDLILALDRLGRDDIELILIGPLLHLEDDARAIVEAAPDRFRLLGERPHRETQGWLASADAVALVSGSEAHSLTAGEAAFAGVPLLTSDLPAMRSAGWRHGHTCLMHPVGNVAILARNIAFLLGEAEERRRLGAAIRAMSRSYAFDTFSRRMLGLVSSLAPRSPLRTPPPAS